MASTPAGPRQAFILIFPPEQRDQAVAMRQQLASKGFEVEMTSPCDAFKIRDFGQTDASKAEQTVDITDGSYLIFAWGK